MVYYHTMVEQGQTVKINIEKIVNGGYGLGRFNDFVIFVPSTLPGEYVEAKIIEKKKNMAFAELVNIIESSPWRVNPKCPYYNECGGCHLQHCGYEKQLVIKQGIVEEFFSKYGKAVKSIKGSKEIFYYRNKVVFRSDGEKTGLVSFRTNKVVDIDECVIANKKINYFYKILKNNINSEFKKDFMIRTATGGELQFYSDGNIDCDDYCIKSINSFYSKGKLQAGNPYILNEIEGYNFKIYPSSFFQVNPGILNEIIIYLKKKVKGKFLIDAYCGTGIFGLVLIDNFEKVLGIDMDNFNIKAAISIKKEKKLDKIEFYTGKVRSIIDSFSKADTVIIDPPRAGCSPKVLEGLINSGCENIVYISCNPATLARDLKILEEKYKVKEIQPFDMFPQTFHFETIVMMSRVEK